MAIKFDRVKPGMTLWTTYRRKMGNTTMSETVASRVTVVSVDADRGWVEARGSNGMRLLTTRELKRWSASDPRCCECHRVKSHGPGCPKTNRAHGGA